MTIASNPNKGRYDLEERTFIFAKEVALFCPKLPKTHSNLIYCNQVIRSSGSIGANYIEANECLGPKDFKMKIKICRKEAKESAYWLKLLIATNGDLFKGEIVDLYDEVVELKKIFSSIANK